MIKDFMLSIISLYQKTISPDHGVFKIRSLGCRFHPSCSEYSHQAVAKYGAAKGSVLAFKRIIRCHPFNEGGIDKLR